MNDHEFLKYFDGEMRWLKAAAREFAEQHPEAGRRLGIDRQSGCLTKLMIPLNSCSRAFR